MPEATSDPVAAVQTLVTLADRLCDLHKNHDRNAMSTLDTVESERTARDENGKEITIKMFARNVAWSLLQKIRRAVEAVKDCDWPDSVSPESRIAALDELLRRCDEMYEPRRDWSEQKYADAIDRVLALPSRRDLPIEIEDRLRAVDTTKQSLALIRFMWHRSSAEVSSMVPHVWEDQPSTGAVKTAVSRANDFLRLARIERTLHGQDTIHWDENL